MTSTWPAPFTGATPVTGRVDVPGSKSLTNRALVLAALSSEPTRITGMLAARDTTLMIEALTQFGVAVHAKQSSVTLTPPPTLRGGVSVDAGLAGTVMRFVPPIAALAEGQVTFDGDARARARPMGPLVSGLRQLGVSVSADALPLTVAGAGAVAGGEVVIDASGSSQFISGLLLAGARFDAGLLLRHRGPALPSLPHIQMTTALLARQGVHVTSHTDDLTDCFWQVSPGSIRGGDVAIEPDLSNAGAFLAAAMVTGGEVRIPRWPAVTTQAGDQLRELFTAMGARVNLAADGTLTLVGPARPRALTADLRAVGELLPTLAAVAAFADGPSHLTGLAHVRGHETDRLAALATELSRLGIGVREEPDGLVILPAPGRGVVVECYHDHRMATFAAIVGLRIAGVSLSDVGATAKTMPAFAEAWTALTAPAVRRPSQEAL